jgi:hypothetical protein
MQEKYFFLQEKQFLAVFGLKTTFKLVYPG